MGIKEFLDLARKECKTHKYSCYSCPFSVDNGATFVCGIMNRTSRDCLLSFEKLMEIAKADN